MSKETKSSTTPASLPGDVATGDRRAEVDAQPWCHIYGQGSWHSQATIEGTRNALVIIRDAIEVALTEGRDGRSDSLFVTDGEGYHLEVKIRNFEYLQNQTLPYMDPIADGVGRLVFDRELKDREAFAKVSAPGTPVVSQPPDAEEVVHPSPLPLSGGGWKLVPVEPTEEMLAAAHDAKIFLNMTDEGWRMAYAAMLAASPSPPPAELPGEEEIARAALAVTRLARTISSDIRLTPHEASEVVRAVLRSLNRRK